MSKPLGVYLGIGEHGVEMGVRSIAAWEDDLWDAVEAAISANITPERFKRELVQAWRETLAKNARYDVEELQK